MSVEDENRDASGSGDAARRLFSRLSEVLFASVDAREVLQRMAEMSVPTLGDWCAIDVVRRDGAFARFAVAHSDAELVAVAHELWNRYPPSTDDPGGLHHVVRTGKSELVAHVPDEAIVAGARDPWHLDALRRLGLSGASYLMIPIRGHAEVFGALTLVRGEGGRAYDATDLAVAEEFGRIAAVVIENGRLFEEVTAARVRAERSEQSVREFVDHLPNLAWTAPADGAIDFYNRRWYEYTGTTFEQMQGWGWTSVHDPERLDSVVARWTESLATGQPFEMEFPLRRADGVFRWFLTRVVPQRDGDGRIVRWFGTNVDIDDIRAARALADEMADQSRLTTTRFLTLTDELRDARAEIAGLRAELGRLRAP